MNETGEGPMNSGVILHAIPPQMLGSAELNPGGSFEAGSYASFTLTYTAGPYGIDDSGSLRICFRFASDQGNPQFDEPSGPNYCTVEASNGAVLQTRWDPKGNVRPWDRTLWIKVVRGFLREGDRITIRFGVTDHGGPGMRLQTFCEETFEFRVLVDPIATFNFQPLPRQPTIAIIPGVPARYVAVLPSRHHPGEAFELRLKGEDRWGNPSDRCEATLSLSASGPVDGLPGTVDFRRGDFSMKIGGLRVNSPGTLWIRLLDETGAEAAVTNPMLVDANGGGAFWGDIHGQSEETIGTGSAREYFAFARDRAFVDACAHQGNDFQITDDFWAELGEITRSFDKAGEFVALPGYEWSGNTALGGDRNVYFPVEDRVIRRSSHALIRERKTADHDCLTAADLFDAFARNGEFDVVCFAHCGGRYADIEIAHDGRFERSVEVHSSWGTFEWLLDDALRLGHRVGIVANSDGHKGRPGASYPGAGKFGAIGGLTCYLMDRLDRQSLLECLRKRHHYATSGGPTGRPLIAVKADFPAGGTLYHDDPALGPAEGVPVTEAVMGDIVHLPTGSAELSVDIVTNDAIERVDIYNGRKLVDTVRPYDRHDLSARIRVMWEGATYRGRFREVVWDGTATLTGNHVNAARPINFFNRDKTLDLVDPTSLAWQSLTTGNMAGFELDLADPTAGNLKIETPPVKLQCRIADIEIEDQIHEAGGDLPRQMRLYRLPAKQDRTLSFSRPLDLCSEGDNAIYLRLTQMDGTRAWTSPIYIFRRN